MRISQPHFQVDDDGSVDTDGHVLVRGFLRTAGAQKVKITSSASTAYVVPSTDHVVLLSASAVRTVTLPDATTEPATGRLVTIVDVANTTAAISVIGAAGNVGGGTTVTQNTALGAKTYASDGTNWWVIS